MNNQLFDKHTFTIHIHKEFKDWVEEQYFWYQIYTPMIDRTHNILYTQIRLKTDTQLSEGE